jgi:predicted TIM-barrel fold metal-dependent hydrolase
VIIDIHSHVFPDALAHAAIIALEEQGDTTAKHDGTVAGMVASMDRAGIDVSVIQPVSTKASQVCDINDWAATVASDRVVPFGGMHPDFTDPAAEIARMRSLGLCGFKMHPEYQSFHPEEPRMAPIYEAASAAAMPILFHSGHDIAFETAKGTPEVWARVLDAWPGLRMIIAHMGGFQLWEEARRHLVGRDLYLDTAYTLGHLPDGGFVELVEAHGAGRVLFGTDNPWTDPADELARLRSLGLADADLEAILGGNAARLLGLGSGQPAALA